MADLHPESIPSELRELPQWVCWKLEDRDGKRTKVPIDPGGGGRAATNRRETWGTFEAARERAERDRSIAGVGFVFTETDPFCGIDLDRVRDSATGEPTPKAAAMIAELATYTEESQSGTGFHLICRAALPAHKGRKGGWIELYDSRRFFVMTGRRHPEAPATIEDRQPQVDALLSRLFPPTPIAPPATPPAAPPTAAPSPQSGAFDTALLSKARAARNGAAFVALYDRGDWQGSGYPSQSEADAALCAMLAYWTGHDFDRIDRLFRGSALVRPKWTDRGDYRADTIQKAMKGGDAYTPPPPRTIYPTAGDRTSQPRADRWEAMRATYAASLVKFLRPSELRAIAIPYGFNMVGQYHIQPGAPFVIAGASGVGKSRAATSLAIAGATGADWFGFRVHRRFKTMILQAENGAVRLRNEYREIEATGLDDFIRVCTPPPFGFAFDVPAFVDQVAAAVADFGPDVFLLDPWNRLATDDKGKDYRVAYEHLLSVLPTGDARPAIGIVAHTRKPRTDERANGRALMNLIAGSYMLASIPRAIFVMQAASDDPTDARVVWTCCKNNDGPLGERSAWERRNGLFAPIPGFDWTAFDGEAVRRTVTEEDMQAVFDGGQRTLARAEAVKALQEVTGLKHAACYKALKTTEDGTFAGRLREADGGALSWT